MWNKRTDRPLPCLRDGDEIMVALELHQHYGYSLAFSEEWCVIAVWDGLNEEFFEKETKQYILDEDIMAWWEDDNNPMKAVKTKVLPTKNNIWREKR